jgi:SAM-dependent methyltransferase
LKYDLAYAKEDYDPSVGKGAWADLVEQIPFHRAIDVGCGPGYGIKVARDAGKDVYGIDIAEALVKKWEELGIDEYCRVSPSDRIPFPDKSFDLVVSTEVFEHIPEEGIVPTLEELKRIGSGHFIFMVANRFVPKSHAQIDNRIQPHLTVKPREWWEEKLRETGYEIQKHTDMGVSNLFQCR